MSDCQSFGEEVRIAKARRLVSLRGVSCIASDISFLTAETNARPPHSARDVYTGSPGGLLIHHAYSFQDIYIYIYVFAETIAKPFCHETVLSSETDKVV